jgi:hypothetical protein
MFWKPGHCLLTTENAMGFWFTLSRHGRRFWSSRAIIKRCFHALSSAPAWKSVLPHAKHQETPGGRLASLDHLRYALRAGVYAKKGAENG